MKVDSDLWQILSELIPDPDARLVGIGERRALQPLTQLFPQLLIIDGLSPLKRLARKPQPVNLIRGAAHQLPLARASLQGLVALDALHRAADPAALVAAWADSLQPGAPLLLSERLQLSASLAGVRRLLHRAPTLRPEVQTSLLLNAGFEQIRQRWPQRSGRRVITCGLLRPFAQQISHVAPTPSPVT